MQDIENDIDDLFRKAVDNYTLQNGASNWETIVSQLADDTKAAVEINYTKGSLVNVCLLILFLLIPVSAAMLSLYKSGNAVGKRANEQMPSYKDTIQQSATFATALGRQNTTTYSTSKAAHTPAISALLYNLERSKNVQAQAASSLVNKLDDTGSNNADVINDTITAVSSAGETAANRSRQNDNAGAALQPVTSKINTAKKPRWYAGIVAGIAFNEVKNQGFKKAGFDVGILAGYRLYKGIAVQAGVVFSRKNYFSNGRYFSMDKMSGSMPAEMKIMSLKGSANIYQLPVALKYDIIHKKQSAFFASAGISSYLLARENNQYKTAMNGVEQNMNGMYKKVTTGFASSADVSIGYEHSFNKTAAISIQPYLQMPLKGIGMGNMQVMSAGIHIAYIR